MQSFQEHLKGWEIEFVSSNSLDSQKDKAIGAKYIEAKATILRRNNYGYEET